MTDDAMPALALSGYYESWTGYMLYGNESGDTEFTEDTGQFVSNMQARLSMPLGESFSIQADGQLGYSSNRIFGEQQDDLYQNSYLFGGHLSWRDPSSGLLGAFATIGGGDHDDDETPFADFLAVGGEGQLYLDNMTLYLQAGYLDSDNDNDFIRDAMFGRGVWSWYFTPDNRLQAELSYVNGTLDSGGDEADGEILEWGVRYDFVVPELPILGDTHMFAGYRGTDFNKDGSDPGGFTDHTFMIGFAHMFGTDSMQDVERYGAGLSLPNFGRWVAAGEALE